MIGGCVDYLGLSVLSCLCAKDNKFEACMGTRVHINSGLLDEGNGLQPALFLLASEVTS